MNNEQKSYLKTWQQEFQTTLKVLRAYPQEKQDLKPAPQLKSARELAWVFANEEAVMFAGIAEGNIDWSKLSPAPATITEAIDAFEKQHADSVARVEAMSEEAWNRPIPFMVAPKQPGQVRAGDLLWMMLHDQIHHRGQFSVYLRLAGAKVPSIYGPTADEPWM